VGKNVVIGEYEGGRKRSVEQKLSKDLENEVNGEGKRPKMYEWPGV